MRRYGVGHAGSGDDSGGCCLFLVLAAVVYGLLFAGEPESVKALRGRVEALEVEVKVLRELNRSGRGP